MNNESKARGQLVQELTEFRKRLEDQGKSAPGCRPLQEALRRSNALLTAINQAHNRFITVGDPRVLFAELLANLITITESESGFIGEVLYTGDGKPYIKTHAITNLAWNEETEKLYERQAATGFEFHNLKTLFGAVITTGQAVMTNDPAGDPRRGGLPPGHPPINSFLGLPLYSGGQLVGLAGLANRPGGYEAKAVDYLQPLMVTAANIVKAFRVERERQAAATALRSSEEMFRQIAEHIREVFWLTSGDGAKMIYISPGYEEIWGRTCQSLYEHPTGWLSAVHPEDCEGVRAAFYKKAVQGKGKYDEEYRIIRPDGSSRWIRDRAFPVRDPGGGVYRIAGIAEDITESRRAKEEIKHLSRQNELILSCVGEGIYGVDLKGRTTFVNPAAVSMAGWEAQELIGRHQHEILHHTRPDGAPLPQEECRIYAAYRDGKVYRVDDEVFWRKDGTSFPVEYTSTPIRDERGQVWGAVVVFRDVSVRRHLEKVLKESEEKYRTLIENLNIGVYRVIGGPHGRFLHANQAMAKIFGYDTVAEFKETPVSKSYQDPQERKLFLEELARQGFVKDKELRLKMKDGTPIWGSVTAKSKYDAKGHLEWVDGVIEDITERKLAGEEMKKLSMAVEQAADWVIITNKEGTIEYVNKAAEEISGYTEAELIGQNPRLLKSEKHEAKFFKELWDTIISGQPHRAIFTNRRKDGELFRLAMTIIPLRDDRGNITHFLSTAKDITQQLNLEEQVKYLAYYDVLTGLPNRTLFSDRLKQALARVEHNQRLVAVLIINLDRFKLIYDTYGMDTGDEVLKEMARRLTQVVREGDTVSRLGDDEFGVSLVDIAQADDVVLVVEKIKEHVSQTIRAQGQEVNLTFSMGIAIYPHDGEDGPKLIQNADTAANKVKELGGNHYQFYAPSMNVKAAEFVLLEKQLFNAIKQGEFILHYQPFVQISRDKIVGLEALIRWQSPEQGLVLPARFIPVLEENGMIREVCEWTLRETLKQIKAWQAGGYVVVPVSVNFSPVQFRWQGLAEMVERLIREFGVDPPLLTVEITESAIMQDVEYTKVVLGRFKDLGLSIAIDDFGTGYSSLSYLKRFPIDHLKIDISFIKDLATDPNAAAIVTAIISMAHNLGLKTIAEGVETREQRQILRLLRCDLMQGFYFSQPLPPTEVEKLFDRQARSAREGRRVKPVSHSTLAPKAR